MIIDPKEKLKTKFFYNNLILIVCIFAVINFVTAIWLNQGIYSEKKFFNLQEGASFGPIIIEKGKPRIYSIITKFNGMESSAYLSGEVQNEEGDALFEFGKDLWHESGYDSDGYWSESDRNMRADLSFTEPGTYIIQLNTEENRLNDFNVRIVCRKGSGIPHTMVGAYLLLFVIISFCILNFHWVRERYIALNDWLEEHSDD